MVCIRISCAGRETGPEVAQRRDVMESTFHAFPSDLTAGEYAECSRNSRQPLSPNTHVVIHVDSERIVTDDDPTPRKMIDPHGISGEGVFWLTVNGEGGCLAGIVLGREPTLDLHIGGHIQTWLHQLEKAVPELKGEIQSAVSCQQS